ncbi:hypothetical protein DFP91_2231 [Pseudorhodoplanes sinuspersici]|nr:hypothetical protein DFP91_2231 [Pseudorhodoplanes sinuspersici]
MPNYPAIRDCLRKKIYYIDTKYGPVILAPGVLKMRTFIFALVVAALLGLGWAFGLNSFQRSVATADTSSSGSVRLDQQEVVNYYGREG